MDEKEVVVGYSKVKGFFANKTVKTVAAVAFVVSVAVLIVCGITVETISGGVVLIGAVIAALGAVVLWIGKLFS
jgi:hypothetical protein